MLNTLNPAILPLASKRLYAPSDIDTFNDILDVAYSLSFKCVEKYNSRPEAAWSFTGKYAHQALLASSVFRLASLMCNRTLLTLLPGKQGRTIA